MENTCKELKIMTVWDMEVHEKLVAGVLSVQIDIADVHVKSFKADLKSFVNFVKMKFWFYWNVLI